MLLSRCIAIFLGGLMSMQIVLTPACEKGYFSENTSIRISLIKILSDLLAVDAMDNNHLPDPLTERFPDTGSEPEEETSENEDPKLYETSGHNLHSPHTLSLRWKPNGSGVPDDGNGKKHTPPPES